MIIKTIGIFHLLHSPLLILFPFVIHDFTWDILYIIYFFGIMFLYTFIDGECPISYVCKLINDKNYIAGKYVTHYPEMEYLLGNQKYIDSYFGIMTSLYLLTLSFVIFRTNTLSYFVIFTCIILLHRPKRKMRQNSIKKIKNYSIILSNDVNAPRRALYYLTTTAYYDCSG
jgi:hypothetical protein